MEKIIKNIKLTAILIIIAYLSLLVFNMQELLNGKLLNIIYAITLAGFSVLLFKCITLMEINMEKTTKIIKIIAIIILIISLIDIFIGIKYSPLKTFRVACWIPFIGSIELISKTNKYINFIKK